MGSAGPQPHCPCPAADVKRKRITIETGQVVHCPRECRCDNGQCQWQRNGTSTMFVVMLAILVLELISPTECKPILLRERRASDSTVTRMVDFLTKYGYLPSSSMHSSNLRTEDQLEEAIRVMQRFAGLNETGQIDLETSLLLRRKRCGMPDIFSRADRVRRYALQGQKWEKNRLTYSISQETSRYADIHMVRREMRKALDVWSDAANLTFTETNQPDADIVIAFRARYHEDGYPFDGKGAVLAHAFFPGDGIGGDAHFDADEPWVPGGGHAKGESVNLFSVAAHEFGHSLGLSHSTTQGSLMFPYYQHVTENYKLPYDDTVGIQQLYGPKTAIKWAPMPPVTYTPSSPRKKTPVTVKPGNRPPVRNPSPEDPDKPAIPQTCYTNIDAISCIRREIFMFKDRYFWRRDERKANVELEPAEIDRFWKNLPTDLPGVDAIYERQTDNKIVFFTGNRYWLFVANDLEPGYPKSLSHLGLPHDLKKIDAAMIWGHNGKTYFFSGNQYWRFDEIVGKVEADYPRHMGLWKGVPENMDSAFQHTDGITYFFKGAYYWPFDDKSMTVKNGSPYLISEKWFNCSRLAIAPPMPPYASAEQTNNDASAIIRANGRTHRLWIVVALLLCAIFERNS